MIEAGDEIIIIETDLYHTLYNGERGKIIQVGNVQGLFSIFDFEVFLPSKNLKINFNMDNNKNHNLKYKILYRNKNLKHLLECS